VLGIAAADRAHARPLSVHEDVVVALLLRHPQVTGALCAGIPDPRLGEVVGAMVTLLPGSRLTGEELRSWALGEIEKFKVPEIIAICDTLLTGSTGKLSRAAVARRLAAAPRSKS